MSSKKVFFRISFLAWIVVASTARADHGEGSADAPGWKGARPDGHAPLGVMGEHTHGAGEFMLSYRWGYMEMSGNRDNQESLSPAEVIGRGFMVSPERMTMSMHMLGAMWAPTDDLTLMAMLPYKRLSMDHTSMPGIDFTAVSEGVSDISLTGLINLFRKDRHRVHLNAGMSFPTGSIHQTDRLPLPMPAGTRRRLPYPMQLGSGTYDLLPGVTYLGQTDDWSWGLQTVETFRLGTNDEGYSLGDRFMATAWVARKWTDFVSTSVRAEGLAWGNIDGADSHLNPAMTPTADPGRRGGERIDILLGVNFYVPSGATTSSWLAGQRLALEFGFPVYQRLEGPQLETDWRVLLGWQWAF